MVYELVAFDAVGTQMRNVIQLNRADDFKGHRVAQDKIDVLGEDLVQPTSILG